MAVRDKNGNWTKEALEFQKEVHSVLNPIFKSWVDTLSLEDMFYIVINEAHCFIIDESLGW